MEATKEAIRVDAVQLPNNLPGIAYAKLPATYEAAKTSLAECSRIDECREWADKAVALASYAKQAGDDSMRKMADRIQARAIKRCGELLRAIAPAKNQHAGNGASGCAPTSRHQAARDAGLSRDRKHVALRVANVPDDEFEAAVESDHPPTVTALAARGTVAAAKPLLDLKGRDPEEFKLSTTGQGALRLLVENVVAHIEPTVIVRGAFPKERQKMARWLAVLAPWLHTLVDELLTNSIIIENACTMPADAMQMPERHVGAGQIIERATHLLTGLWHIAVGLDGLDVNDMEPAIRTAWAEGLAEPLRRATRVVTALREVESGTSAPIPTDQTIGAVSP